MTITDTIMISAREEIKNNLITNIGKIYLSIHNKFPNFGKDEEVVLYNYDLVKTPNICLITDNVITKHRLHCIRVCLDDSVFIEVENADGTDIEDGEYNVNDLTFDEFSDIANAVEVTYNEVYK